MRADTGEVYCAGCELGMGGTFDYAAPQPGTITARAQAQKQENRKRILRESGRSANIAIPARSRSTHEAHQAHQAHEGRQGHEQGPAVTLYLRGGDARLAKPAVAPPTRACGPRAS